VIVAVGSDLWSLHSQGYWVVIPTTTTVKPDGEAVMEEEWARAAAARYPDLPREYGRSLAEDEAFAVFPNS